MKYIILIAILANSFAIAGNNLPHGVPFVTNYSERDFKVSTMNYDIVQDERGIMYFGNEFGVLEFDGSNWSIVTAVSNHSNIKSLAVTKENRIYAGAQGDFGYLDHQNGGVVFHSLLDKIPGENRDFNDVWEILLHQGKVYFHTWQAIYIYSADSIEVLKTGRSIKGLYKVKNHVLMHDVQGLHKETANGFEVLPGTELLGTANVNFILPLDDKLLIGTQKNGLFIYHGHSLKPYQTNPRVDFEAKGLSAGLIRRNGDYVIGTLKDGLYIINNQGEVISHLTKKQGLQNNSIRSLYSDKHNNLWVTNKMGVDLIELSTPLSHIKASPDAPVGVYSSCYYNDNLYLATHDGLLYYNAPAKSPNSHSSFTRVDGSDDINWNLIQIGSAMVVAHANGFSQLVNGSLVPLFSGTGGWTLRELTHRPGYYIAGTYQGLILLKEEKGRLKFIHHIEGFKESSRVVEVDKHGAIWVAHGYRGLYKLELDNALTHVKDLSFYNRQKGLPSHMFNTVFKVWDELIFGTQVGFYKYNPSLDSMMMHPQLTDILGYDQGRMLNEDSQGNLWFVSGDKSGIIRKHADGSFSVETVPFTKLNKYYIPGFENFHFINNELTLVGTKDGVVLYDKSLSDDKTTAYKTLLRRVSNTGTTEVIYEDNVQYLCQMTERENIEIPFRELKNSSLRLNFSASYYEDIESIKFKYFLQGFDDDWSGWEDVRYKEYTSLREGDYLFRLKAINIYGTESAEVVYKFTVLPPWYRTIYAYFVYLLVAVSVFYVVIRVRERRAKVEKRRYIEKQERIRKLEQAAFTEERLKNELENKNKELAAIAMKTICKNEQLSDLQSRITTIKEVASKQVEKKLSDLLGFIESEIANDDWDDFELRFDLAHNNFIKKLKEEYPVLSPHDLKICAYLKMNLSSKEIAQLLNMTVRGVENARYRVRKRLELDSSIHLTDWLMSR